MNIISEMFEGSQRHYIPIIISAVCFGFALHTNSAAAWGFAVFSGLLSIALIIEVKLEWIRKDIEKIKDIMEEFKARKE